MSDYKRLIKWLNNTQYVIDAYCNTEENYRYYSTDGSRCPQAILDIKKLIIDELSKLQPIISESLINAIEKEIKRGIINANDTKSSFFSFSL